MRKGRIREADEDSLENRTFDSTMEVFALVV